MKKSTVPTRFRTARLAVLAALVASLPLHAAAESFFGAMARYNPLPSPGGRCPSPALTIINTNAAPLYSATGTSNFGSFLIDASACVVPPPTATTDGIFTFTFASGGTIFGTTGSTLTPSATPGVFDIVGSFVVTGGTGVFAGATGLFSEIGTLDRRTSVAYADGVFRGDLNLAPVPEPATWALMLLGIGAAGAVARRRSPASAGC